MDVICVSSFINCKQTPSFVRIGSNLQDKSLMENLFFVCSVYFKKIFFIK